MNQAGLFLPVPVFGQNRAKMAYFQTQGRGGQTHSNLKINIFFWFPTENYNRNHPLIRELVLVPPLLKGPQDFLFRIKLIVEMCQPG